MSSRVSRGWLKDLRLRDSSCHHAEDVFDREARAPNDGLADEHGWVDLDAWAPVPALDPSAALGGAPSVWPARLGPRAPLGDRSHADASSLHRPPRPVPRLHPRLHHDITRRGYAPSFDELGAHFGTTPPTVNSMIKLLERKGLLSRVPGAARSLRVLVPADQLPGSEFGARPAPSGKPVSDDAAAQATGQGELAAAAAIAVLDALVPLLLARTAVTGEAAVHLAAEALQTALVRRGLDLREAAGAARALASERARWAAGGTVVRRFRRVKTSLGAKRARR